MPEDKPDYSVDPNSGAAPQPGGVGNPTLVPSATGTQSEEPAPEGADADGADGADKADENAEPTSDQDGATDTGQLQPPAEEASNTRTAKKTAAKK